ncbi:MAG: aldehyde dehydrogenase family protein [Pirellulaceae bacterium]|nr:aldehyde dehydrogenase family protein [Planctomycetales bacterium]
MYNLVNPFDQSVLGEIAYHRPSEIQEKLDVLEIAQQQLSSLSLGQRQQLVREGVTRLVAQRDQVARDISLQMGKPIAQSQREVDTFVSRAQRAILDAETALAGDEIVLNDGITRRIEHAPLGIVFNIGAWNYPLLIPVNVIVPALLAGNTVLLKHSAKTPWTGSAIASAFGQLPELPNLVCDCILDHDAACALVTDARIAHVAFTGSVRGGHHICEAAAARFIDVGLELGGKDPAYVACDADLDFAAENIVDGACYNAGQSCCAIERVYVHKDVYDAFLEKCLPFVQAYKLGDPFDSSTTLGPLARRAGLKELKNHVDTAIADGARLLAGGHPVPGTAGNFFEPTLLADVPQSTLVMQEESFGPLIPVAAVPSDEEAIARMNDSRYGLTASVWTRDRDRAMSMARQLQAGTIFQNRCDFVDPSQPWTGWGDSGRGSTLSRYGFWNLTRRKSLHLRG